ncbi:MAG: malate dehydrogenase (quinone) [Halioglobus sp.]|nr:malate dehydrogenase (quinone) [Halioglobus sp.]
MTNESIWDITLIGAGIMSATLATFLRELDPDLRIAIFEARHAPAEESSDAWNNAGTGHAALCEVNYTPERKDGSIDIAQALEINVEFDISRQFWSYLLQQGAIESPDAFIHSVPHMTFVCVEDQIDFLRRRHAALTSHFCYHGMQFSQDPGQIAEWAPLVMAGRNPQEQVAATHMRTGSDVDYGALTRLLLEHVGRDDGCKIHYDATITDLERLSDNSWQLRAHDEAHSHYTEHRSRFVYIGAGGGALPLLQKSGIPEGHGYAGFPVSGIWLRCEDDALARRHHAKVYGKAAVGAPPMSVPHLDHRVIDGRHALLFGPFAGASTRFLKHGSLLDLLGSIRWDNIGPMVSVAIDNLQLLEYLAGQVVQSEHHRFAALRSFYPEANHEDWVLQVAGQRVQIIERAPGHKEKGVLKLGTELVNAADHSLVAMLGASPGASTAAYLALEVLASCFPEQLKGPWAEKLKQIIPSYGQSIAQDENLCRQIRASTAAVLGLEET